MALADDLERAAGRDTVRASAAAFAMRQLLRFLPLLALLGCGPENPLETLHIGHALDTEHPVHTAMLHIDERLRHYSNNTMAVEVFPNGQLGHERELIELLQLGALAMTKVSASPLEGFVPTMKIFNIPYLFRDAAHYQAVLDGAVGQELLAAPQSARLRGLGYYDAGSRSFYSTERPVYTPEDLTGLKIRVQESQTALNMVRQLGGSPTPIAWGELYTALQQGVVDGAENNPPSFYLSKHYEIARYFTLDEHTAVPDLLLISESVWSQLNTTQQQWLQRAVDDSVALQRGLWQDMTEAALANVAAAGVTIIRPDKGLFRTRVAAMKKSYEGTDIGQLIARIDAVVPDRD